LHPCRKVLDAGRIKPGIRLRNTEASAVFSGNQGFEHPLLLFLGAEHDHCVRPEEIQVNGAGGRIAAGAGRHFMHHDGGLREAEIGAAKIFRHGNA
jgi:hypothetical protein